MTAEESRMEKLTQFFRYKYNLEVLQEFVPTEGSKRRSKLSLRLLEWFVVNYAQHYGVRYNLKRPDGRIKTIMVWIEYEAISRSEGKQFFDPFRRGSTSGKIFDLEYEPGKTISTTVAQLNFFRWAIKYGIIDYVKKHLDEIYQDMTTRGTTNREKGKKRHLSTSVSKTLSCHELNQDLPVIVSTPAPAK